jgi:hypothetical protein
VVSLLGNALDDHVHHFRNQSWETLENLVDNGARDLFQLLVGILNKFKSWISELLELRVDQVDEDID